LSYEVADAKLSGAPRIYQLLQLCFYSELLQTAQGGDPPERAHLIVASATGERRSFRLRRLLGRLLLAEPRTDCWDTCRVPVKHCEVCRSREVARSAGPERGRGAAQQLPWRVNR